MIKREIIGTGYVPLFETQQTATGILGTFILKKQATKTEPMLEKRYVINIDGSVTLNTSADPHLEPRLVGIHAVVDCSHKYDALAPYQLTYDSIARNRLTSI
jgi:hypothetical protein